MEKMMGNEAFVNKPDSQRSLRVFLCHASSDKPAVRKLYQCLCAEGIDAWLDEEKLLPGQDWRHEIPKAIRDSDVVIVCLSRHSVGKFGFVQKEIISALDVADEQPENTIYIIPLKLEDCKVPSRLSRWQWVDYYEENGRTKLLRALVARSRELGVGAALKEIPRTPGHEAKPDKAEAERLERERQKREAKEADYKAREAALEARKRAEELERRAKEQRTKVTSAVEDGKKAALRKKAQAAGIVTVLIVVCVLGAVALGRGDALRGGGLKGTPTVPTALPSQHVSPTVPTVETTPTPTATPTWTPTVTPTWTPTATPTNTPTSTPTPNAAATAAAWRIAVLATAHARPPAGSSRILFSDNFSGPAQPSTEDTRCDGHSSNGEYHLHIKGENALCNSRYQQQFSNIAIEVDIRSVMSGYWEGGIAFRSSPPSDGCCRTEYVFQVNSSGRYFLRRWITQHLDEKTYACPQVYIVPVTQSPYLRTGMATNRLKVVAQGNQITLYANDHFLTSVTDVTYTSGKVGLVDATYQAYGNESEVAFDNLLIWSVP